MGEKLISLSKKISSLVKNPRHQKKWRGIAGVAFIVCFILFTVVFDGSNIALALKNSGYGYGYGYGATEIDETTTAGYYGYGYQLSDYPPAALGSFRYTVSGTSATFTWTYPTTTSATPATALDNPSGVCYKVDSATAITSTDTLGACGSPYSSVAYGTTTASVSGLTAGTTYYYAFQAYDDNYAYGTATYGSFTTGGTTTTSSGGGGSAAGGGGTPTSAVPATGLGAPTTGAVTAEIAVPKLPATRDLAKEKAAIIEMRDYLGFLPSTDAEWKMIQYIAYGAGPGSAKLSPRDRRGVLGDFKDTYGYYPTTAAHWIDIELILTSHKPKGRNLNKERWAITEFQKIYKRLPVWSTVGDDWAVTYIAYKVRNVSRNLASERAGIATFKSVYKRIPVSSQDWATVRAITYTGAKR